MAERKESAADIIVSVDNEDDLVVERLTLSKDIDIETIHGSNRTFPDGYAINSVEYQGTMELQGNRLDLQTELFDSWGLPKPATIVITHLNGKQTTYNDVLVTSEGWEMSSGEATTTTYEFMAMDKGHGSLADFEGDGVPEGRDDL